MEVVDGDDSVVPVHPSNVKTNDGVVASDVGNSTSLVNSDLSNPDDEEDEDNYEDGGSDYYENEDDDDDDDYDYDDDDYMYAAEDDNYSKMQSQFDNVDYAAGVEMLVSWMEPTTTTKKTEVATSSSLTVPHAQTCSVSTTVPVEVQKVSQMLEGGASSSGTGDDGNNEEVIQERYEGFPRFDTVEKFTDHHYADAKLQNSDKNWAKKVQEEWKVLEKNLPDTIYVRVSESRMELLRAVMIGPAGTPYHDGLFTFDAVFPPNYPNGPPMVFYYSGGLRLNPNLYDCGKVCLSLLHTWPGKPTEMWIPGQSTMLQVLVSIQALILNADPFFNEPGYDESYKGQEGAKLSRSYNSDVFILSLKTMMYTLRRPPLHFEDFVVGHFRARAHNILAACKAYIEGVPVGSALNGETQKGKPTSEFKHGVSGMMKMLIKIFTNNGSKDLEQFQPTSAQLRSTA